MATSQFQGPLLPIYTTMNGVLGFKGHPDPVGEINDGSAEALKKAIGYKTPVMERCCAKCAFSTIDGNDSWDFKQCNYIASSCLDDGEVNDFGVCNRFISRDVVKLLKDCNSPEELDVKLAIFDAQLDDLLLTEIKDGFGCCEKATKKMRDYAATITKMLRFSRGQMPLQIDIRKSRKDGTIGGEAISVSSNFMRVNVFIKEHVDAYKRALKTRSWSKMCSLFSDDPRIDDMLCGIGAAME